jgi:hypothetical protein
MAVEWKPLAMVALLVLFAIFVLWPNRKRVLSSDSYKEEKVPMFQNHVEPTYDPPGGSPYDYEAPGTRADHFNMNVANQSSVGHQNAPIFHEEAHEASLMPPGETHHMAADSKNVPDRFGGQAVASAAAPFARASNSANIGTGGKSSIGSMFNPANNASTVFNTQPIPMDASHSQWQ